jgi:hypothetical protein
MDSAGGREGGVPFFSHPVNRTQIRITIAGKEYILFIIRDFSKIQTVNNQNYCALQRYNTMQHNAKKYSCRNALHCVSTIHPKFLSAK